jgi:hypothetical protein
MATWGEVSRSALDFAEAVRRLSDAHKHKTMAALERDGSPRISGIEATFEGEDLWLGTMPLSRKAQDLRRDARMALHTASVSEQWSADAKLSGRAVEVPAGANRFRIEITRVVLTRLGDRPIISSSSGGVRRTDCSRPGVTEWTLNVKTALAKRCFKTGAPARARRRVRFPSASA